MSTRGEVLVTGASGGIGSAIVAELARTGYLVTASDLRFAEGTERLPGVNYVEADLLNQAEIEALVAGISGGKLKGLVNAAGVAFFDHDGSVFELSEETWNRTLGVNLNGMRLTTKAALPLLRQETGASIVNIASIAGTRGMDSPLDAYQVSKAAVVSLSRSMALQLGPEGIRCNTVCPGAILTPMIDFLYERSPERREDMELRTPMRRLGLPSEIATAVEFLLSDRASFVTATDLVVDGGWSMQIK